ncbi:MAG: acetoin utilization protein AcuC [Chloroflexota bacterium]
MSITPARAAAKLVDHPDFLLYDFGPSHPLRPERITSSLQLLDVSGLWNRAAETLHPFAAESNELALVHAQHFIRAVEGASSGHHRTAALGEFGLSSSDNPVFPNMHYASSLVAGGTLTAVRQVLSGDMDHAFNPAGGLHHAQFARASGFCIYNDPAIAAAAAVREYGARVLYIDLDCHHGDGVQWLFYDTPEVLTVSFHESGQFLFPGTGTLEERGTGNGTGYSINMPFEPFTTDESWIESLETLLPGLSADFEPDIIISNHGCDTHVWDPLTHMNLTTRSLEHQVRMVHALAHEHCNGKWVAVGSGGYDWRRVVPRSWAILWAEMTDRTLPHLLPADWQQKWLQADEEPAPVAFQDGPELVSRIPARERVAINNRDTLRKALKLAVRLKR